MSVCLERKPCCTIWELGKIDSDVEHAKGYHYGTFAGNIANPSRTVV